MDLYKRENAVRKRWLGWTILVVAGVVALAVAFPATVYVPEERDVIEGGKPIEQAEGVELLRMGEGETVLAVGSGTYEFVVAENGSV